MSPLYRHLRRPFETAAFRLALATVARLPRRAVLGLAWLGGSLGFCFDRRGRAVGLANLELAFGPAKTAAEKRAILKAAYITMARTFLDVIWFGTRSAERLSRYVEPDPTLQPLLCNKNQICITAHFGNWETVGQMMALHRFPLHSIAMPVKNPAVDRMLIARREVTGQKIIPRQGALRKLLGVLRDQGKAAFLVDQNTSEKHGGIWVNYFGLPVPVTPAPAALAARTGSELFVGFCAPQPGGRYRVYVTDRFLPPAPGDEAAVHALTQQVLTAIENEVRRHPEHWLWMYKRWKKIRPGTAPDRYPFYAKPAPNRPQK
jgi:lauroyl/myristoyl acyltransferase